MFKNFFLTIFFLTSLYLQASSSTCCYWQPKSTAEKILVSQNIISLAPNITEIVCYLGGENRLIGITNDCNFPIGISKKRKVGKYTFPDLEKILALQPAVVIAENSADPRFLQKLQAYNIEYKTYNFRNLSVFFKELKKINKEFGFPGKNKIQKLENLYAKKHKPANNKKILIMIWQKPYIVAGSDVFLSEYFKNLGYENIIRRKGYPNISYEYLLKINPDILVNLSSEKIKLPAKTLIIKQLDSDIMMRLSPRLIEYYEKLSL